MKATSMPTPMAMHERMRRFLSSSRCSRNPILPSPPSSLDSSGESGFDVPKLAAMASDYSHSDRSARIGEQGDKSEQDRHRAGCEDVERLDTVEQAFHEAAEKGRTQQPRSHARHDQRRRP